MREPDIDKRLNEYRVEIQDLTRTILALARARQKVSLKIADIKEELGSEIESRTVEHKLSAKMLAYAKSLGLDQELAKSLIATLIEYSKIAQRRRISMKLVKSHLGSNGLRTISIVGAGRMGTWFARYFREIGKRVILFDGDRKRALTKSREIDCEFAKTFDDAAQSDIIVVAVPITSAPKEIRRLIQSRYSARKKRIIEISSVKSKISEAHLLDNSKLPKNVELYSIHPLFGPNANSYSVNTMIHVGKSSKFVTGLFPHFRWFTMNWKEHDLLMSSILTLPHSHALVFADTVARRLKNFPKDISSPSFDHMLELTGRVLSENPDVYFEIQSENPFADRALRETISSLVKLRRSLKARRDFRSFFNKSLLQDFQMTRYTHANLPR